MVITDKLHLDQNYFFGVYFLACCITVCVNISTTHASKSGLRSLRKEPPTMLFSSVTTEKLLFTIFLSFDSNLVIFNMLIHS